MRRLEVVNQDLVREEIGRVDEAGLEELVQEVVGAGDEAGVFAVLPGEGGRVSAQFDFLRHDGGSEGLVANVVGAAEDLGEIGD